MNDLNDTLPDLMHRATEHLEPESTDLVERGMQRGLTLRRRRRTLLGFTGATAVVATAGVIIGGTQLFGSAQAPSDTPAASTSTRPAASAPASPRVAARPVTPADTLATLRKLLPPGLRVSAPRSSYHDGGHSASVVLDDGRGASLLTVLIATTEVPHRSCAGLHGKCSVQPDGSVVASVANESLFPFGPPSQNPGGIRQTVLDVSHPDATVMALYNFNAPKAGGAQHTRATPILSVADLTRISKSTLWTYPPKFSGSDKPDPDSPGAGKPTVPLAETRSTLMKVLPSTLQLTKPRVRGGGTEGFNAAGYLVDDGKGAALVEVLVTYDVPVTKCSGEGAQHCQVRPDGSVLNWSNDERTYGDARNGRFGVLMNRVQVNYADGRTISMTSFNAQSEKDQRHTRPKPTFAVSQLVKMATDSRWKFPGTGKN